MEACYSKSERGLRLTLRLILTSCFSTQRLREGESCDRSIMAIRRTRSFSWEMSTPKLRLALAWLSKTGLWVGQSWVDRPTPEACLISRRAGVLVRRGVHRQTPGLFLCHPENSLEQVTRRLQVCVPTVPSPLALESYLFGAVVLIHVSASRIRPAGNTRRQLLCMLCRTTLRGPCAWLRSRRGPQCSRAIC